MALKRTRSLVMHFYQDDGGRYYKAWQAAHGGWWVDVVDAAGETVTTLGYMDSLGDAETFMEGHGRVEDAKQEGRAKR